MKRILCAASALMYLAACGARVTVHTLEAGGGTSTSGGASSGGTSSELEFACAEGVNDCVTWTDPTKAPECAASPLSLEPYTTQAELDALLIGRWRRCSLLSVRGEDVGVEFSADGRYYPLTFNEAHQVVRRLGSNFEGSWLYLPPGSLHPITHERTTKKAMSLNGVYTDAPEISNDPRQMQILFNPAPSKYVPLHP